MPKSEQGVRGDRYRVIPRTLIFLCREDSVLLIKGAPTKRLWANRYNGIGGHIESGEDVLSAARRELKEETGLEGIPLRLVGTVMIDAGESTGIALYVFKGQYEAGTLIASEEGELEWAPVDRLETFPLVEDLPVILPHVLKAQPGDAPFSARSYYDEQDQMHVVIADA